MNCSKHRKGLECGGNPVRPDDAAFERRSIANSDLQQRVKAVSRRLATALQDASRAMEISQFHDGIASLALAGCFRYSLIAMAL